MMFNFWKKQNNTWVQKRLLKNLIKKIEIPESDKQMFLWAVEIISDEKIESLYEWVLAFIKDLEIKEVAKISQTSYVSIDWLSQQEAENKRQELNWYNLLLTNV